MNREKDQPKESSTPNEHQPKQDTGKPRSSAFNEQAPGDEKSTSNIEEADLEQERKDAMTERD
ncbi:MAG: hypothetical protein ACXWB9_08755 [Flavisolibacter sp.]